MFREIDDTIIALNLNSGQYYTLNEIGTQIWTLIAEQQSQKSIIDHIMSEYDVGRENVEQDLLNLLENLQQNDLVEEVPTPS